MTERVRDVLPGSPLVLTVDAGEERWTLGGEPVHAGAQLYLLTEGPADDCAACDGAGRVGAGRVGAGDARRDCPGCGGRGYHYAPTWIPVRFEYVNAGDGTGEALLYVAGPGLRGEPRHAIRVRAGDELRCRWPRGRL